MPSSDDDIFPSPFLSNKENASLNSETVNEHSEKDVCQRFVYLRLEVFLKLSELIEGDIS